MEELGRAWRRRVLAAGGLAAVVPAAIVGAAVAVGFGGGGGRLDALGQAFSGPRVPAVQRPVLPAPRRSARSRDPSRLLADLGAPRSGMQSRPGSGAGPRSSAPGAPAPRTVPVPRPGARDPAPGSRPAPSGGGGGGAGAPPPEPTPPPSFIGATGDTVEGVVTPVPVAGGPAAGLVDRVADEAEKLPVP